MGIKLQEREFALFKLLLDHRFTNMDLITEFIWHDISQGHARKRIWQLQGGKNNQHTKYLTKSGVDWLSDTIYTLDRTFFKVMKNNSIFFDKLKNAERKDYNGSKIKTFNAKKKHYWNKRNKKIKITTFEHDYILQKVRLILENKGLIEDYIADSYIHTQFYRERFSDKNGKIGVIPDAVSRLVSTQDKIALELEKTPKSEDRYENKIINYSKSQLDYVFWIYTDKSQIKNRIMEVLHDLSIKRADYNTKNHFFMSVDNLYNGEFILSNLQNKKIDLMELGW